MRKLLPMMVSGLMVIAALMGCQREDAETKKQLLEVQAELEKQKNLTAQMQAKALQEQEAKEQERLELEKEELAKDLEATSRKTTENTSEKNKEQSSEKSPSRTTKPQESEERTATKQAPPPKPQPKKITEKIVRYPATVVTSSGYGQLSLRGEPSTRGIEVGRLDDGDEVYVVAKTSKCEVIGRVEGYWVKVDIGGIKGYMFDGYLNREVLSQADKESLYGNQNDSDEYNEYDEGTY